jgi:cyclophilin family peptidyl-prolyl cis-trans isomerase
MKRTILLLLLGLSLSMEAYTQDLSPEEDYLITLTTDFGSINLILYDETPVHKANFIKLVQEGFYNDLLFHRVIQNFMIQGGDPNSKNAAPEVQLGDGDVGYELPAEFNPALYHKKGVIAAARNGDDVNPERKSSGCQFYIVQGKKFTEADFIKVEQRIGRAIPDSLKEIYRTIGGTPHLDLAYTVFGEVVKGLEVVDDIAAQRTNPANRPLVDVKMQVTATKMSRKEITEKYGYTY